MNGRYRYKQQWGKGLRPQKYDALEDKNGEGMVRSLSLLLLLPWLESLQLCLMLCGGA